ncbi:uncharacterized protein LOC107871453 isoform X2 [Capsicum annuum]|uniref:uncharacterized protein LOC107871453 isoform X2 n=1 Tax=Capsicum annuum TaxID=4072 RepID=UPI001FB0FA26|nr:uncharacterized protein LOC107871453 isoform X2 [Capsicum annuum]
MPHTSGRKSHAQIIDEVFRKTHTRENTQPVNEIAGEVMVKLEVQKATSAMKIEMAEKLVEAQKEMEAMDKKLSKAKEDKEAVERKLSEAKMDMEVIIVGRVKAGVQAYLESLDITFDAYTKSGQINNCVVHKNYFC